MSLKDIEHDIEATEQTLLAIASKEPDSKDSKHAAATSLLALLRLKAQISDASSQNNHQLVRDSCTSLSTPQPGSGHSSHPYSLAHSALLDTKLQECCSVLEPVIDKATLSELMTVLDSLYSKQLQLLSHRSQAEAPKQPDSLPATAAPVHLDANHQPNRQDGVSPENAHGSGDQSPAPAQQPVAVAVTWQERSSMKGGSRVVSPHGAPNLALPEDAPNLASSAPSAFAPLAGRGTPLWGPPGMPPSSSNPVRSRELLLGELREREAPLQVLHSNGNLAAASGAVEVDRNGRVVASASGQHAAAAASGWLPAPRARVVSVAEREAALRTQLEEAEALCEEYAGRLKSMEQRCAEVDLLKGENERQTHAIADLHQRLRAAEEEGNARAELLTAVNADQAEIVEELSREIEAVRAENATTAPARALLESRAAEAEAAAAAAAEEAAAAKLRAAELEQQVESLQEEVAAAAHLRRQVADQAAALEAAAADLTSLRADAALSQDTQDRTTAALQAQLEQLAAQVAELQDHNMALRVEAGQARQLLQLRTEALAHSDAQLELLRQQQATASVGPATSHVAAVQPSSATEAGAVKKEIARLRAALAASEGQRRRDAEAAERAAAALKAEVERLRAAARPGTAPGPTTPDRRSGPPARRGSGSSAGRSEGPPADAAMQFAGLPGPLWPAADCRGHSSSSSQLEHRWQYSPNAASPLYPRDITDQGEHAELAAARSEAAQWQERCAVLEKELRWMQALAIPGAAPGPAAPAGRPDAFPLDRYLSASPPAGLSIQSAWQQLSASEPSQHSPFSSPQLPQATAEAFDPRPRLGPGVAAGRAGSCGDSSASGSSEPLADTDMDALLHSLEAAVLKSSQPQASAEQQASSRPGKVHIPGNELSESAPNQAEVLGAIRSDIVAALQRRGDLQAELQNIEASVGAAESKLAQVQLAEEALHSRQIEADKLAHSFENTKGELRRLEAQVQNGYTQLESLGAAEQFASPQRSKQSSSVMQDSQSPEAEASEGVKLLLQKLKQANATADRFKKDLMEARAEVSAMQRQMAERESTAAAELAASEAALREARHKLRCLEAQQPLSSGSRRVGIWDDVIEEAAGELAEVEGQLHTASQQLLDLRSATAQLSADAQKASVAKEQAEMEAEEARERLSEALAEASAARHDAARHRAAAGAAEQERRATGAERDRLAAEASRLEGEVQRLTRQLDEATTSLQEQERALLNLQQDRERAAAVTQGAQEAAELAQQRLKELQEQQRHVEGKLEEATASHDRLKCLRAQAEAELAKLQEQTAAQKQKAEADAASAAASQAALQEHLAQLEREASTAAAQLAELEEAVRAEAERVSALHQQREAAAKELQQEQLTLEAAGQRRRREEEAADAAAAEAAAARRERVETQRSLVLAQDELASLQLQLQKDGTRRRLNIYTTPERDPYLASPSATVGPPHHHRYPQASPAYMEQPPRYSPGYGPAHERSPYGAGGTGRAGIPDYMRGDQQEMSHLEEEVTRLRARLAAQSASQAEAMSGLVDEVQQLRRENGEKTKECDELNARVDRVSAELAEERRRAEAASADAARAEVRLRSVEAQKASLAAEVQSLKRLLKRAEDDRAGLITECQGVTERLSVAASQREAYERECEGLTERLRAAEAARAAAVAEADAAGRRARAAEAAAPAAAAVADASAKLRAELRAAAERAAAAEAQLAASRGEGARGGAAAAAELAAAHAAVREGEASRSEMERRLTAAAKERDALEGRLATAERRRADSEARAADAERQRSEAEEAESFSQMLLPRAGASPAVTVQSCRNSGEEAAVQAELASLRRQSAQERAVLRDLHLQIQQSRAELDSAHAAKRQLDEVQRQLAELERDLCRGHPTVHCRT
ncbi:hypothetical protein COCOBI_15-0730 [Coccomyxa sp. Obi]|nr:hypothetical protein COCOBI_15-0730 [Coccomyxa sp. Obi]